MSILHKWAAASLVALGVFCFVDGVAQGQTFLGRGLGLQKCFYRVYYRNCEADCWKVYATYADCRSAQQALDFLQFTGREGYQASVCAR